MVKLHGTLYCGKFTPVVLHKLRVAVRFFNLEPVFTVVVEKGKTGVVTCVVYFFEIHHQVVEPGIVDGGMGREQLYKKPPNIIAIPIDTIM
jgi:hypothetical protein